MNFAKDIENCLRVLKAGGIILYPTDTIWGIGCDATNAAAVAKIYALKQRDEKKSMIILVASENEIKHYSTAPSDKIKSLLATTNKPLTIIYPNAKKLSANLINEEGTIAIRVVKDEFCKILIDAFGKPIVSTSANISGEKSEAVFFDISNAIINGVDYVCEHKRKEETIALPSRIVKWTEQDELIVLRE